MRSKYTPSDNFKNVLTLLSNKDKSISFFLAFSALILEFPIQNIVVFQEYYWGYIDYTRDFIKMFIKIPIFVYLLVLFTKDLIKRNLDRNSIIKLIVFLILITYILIVVLLFWNRYPDLSIRNIKFLGYSCYFYIIGYFFLNQYQRINRYSLLVFIGQAIMILQIIVFFNWKAFSINYDVIQSKGYIHLLMGNSFAIWAIITLSLLKGRRQLFMYFLFSIFLFTLSSRAAFYCYLALFPFVVYQSTNIKFRFINIVTVFLMFIVLYFSFQDHRMFTIFSFKDPSLLNRIEIIRTGIPDIINNFFTGNYGGFLDYEYPSNMYIHNILSYWRQFGIIPFFIIVILIVITGKDLFNKYYTINNLFSFFTLSLYIFLVVSVIFAKSYFYSSLFLILGVRDNDRLDL